MTLAIVVQRYGADINGGAELHARYVAERLARHARVEVWTTCATDYVTWANAVPPGTEEIHGVTVRRFPVRHPRDPKRFGRLSEQVFTQPHSLADELAWLDAEGPASPGLIAHIRRHSASVDFCLFFSVRYYQAYHGIRAAKGNAILVPTAERDPAIGLSLFPPIFNGVRALMYNSPEERAMIQAVAGNDAVPSVVVGIGSEVPSHPQPHRFRQKHNIRGPFALYIGRIDENKGCAELFRYFEQYVREQAGQLTLVLVGNAWLEIPSHPRIRHLGFLSDAEKFDALAAAELLIMPSYFESLSMVALEAWALGKPVLANGACDVLKGQCLRSNAGLFYESAEEFVEALRALEHTRWIAASLGRNGRQFYREHYDWPVIDRKYLDMLQRLSQESTPRRPAALPGWLARRRETCPPAMEVLNRLPRGPVLDAETSAPRVTNPMTPPLPRRSAPQDRPAATPPRGREREPRSQGGRDRRRHRGGRQGASR